MSQIFPKSMTVKQAVISTLAYFDLFDVPLTRDGIYENFFFLPLDKKKIDIYLRESPLIQEHDGLFSLKRNIAAMQNFYEYFMAKIRRSKKYWKKVHRWQWLLAACPFVKLVAVCNSLPIRAVEDDSDIDLLVITDKKHMFTARFFLTLLTSLSLTRRNGNSIRKRFCLSFYITEDNLDLSEIEQKPYDIYLAYWLKTLEPITGDYQTYEQFMLANRGWLKPYFGELTKHRRRFRKTRPWQQKIKSRLEKWFGSQEFEIKMRNWQLRRAFEKSRRLPDQSGTIITEKMLKFHDKDVREKIRHDWVARINEFL